MTEVRFNHITEIRMKSEKFRETIHHKAFTTQNIILTDKDGKEHIVVCHMEGEAV